MRKKKTNRRGNTNKDEEARTNKNRFNRTAAENERWLKTVIGLEMNKRKINRVENKIVDEEIRENTSSFNRIGANMTKWKMNKNKYRIINEEKEDK